MTEVVLNFRRGIRWSDGAPMTVDDYLFWWNDVVLTSDPVVPPPEAIVGGEIMTVEKIDDYSLRFSFAGPNPLFIEMASRGFYNSAAQVVPAHYLRQFHPQYNTDVTDLTELNNRLAFGAAIRYVDMPSLRPWVITELVQDQYARFERNPYYWKVDTAGNQLPYIDSLDVQIATGTEFTLRAIAGELDMQARGFQFSDIPLLLENQEAGDYRVVMWNSGDFGWPWLILMYDYVDPGIVDLMYNVNFRRALSYAIDRDEINEVTAFGLSVPRQFALSPESPEFQSADGQAFYEEWVNSYAVYEPETAMALLDEIGVVDANGDGFRERPDGTPLELIVDISSADQRTIDSMELVRRTWESIGLRTTLNIAEGAVIDQRAEAGEVMIRAWPAAAAWGLLSAPTVWTPIQAAPYTVGGIRIARYYQSQGADGVAPREGSMLERLTQLYDQLIAEPDADRRNALLLDAYRIHIDEGPISIGTVGESPAPVVVRNNFRNVQDFGLVAGWDLSFPGTADPEQFFFQQ
jgi:peptide/nickel transport system substrate-binding protein